jgi:hypothetical protein
LTVAGLRRDARLETYASTIKGTITGSDADTGGGLTNDGTMTIADSRIIDNSASGCAGLINGGTLTMSRTTVAGNGGASGPGGICNGGVITLTNSAITGNSGLEIGGIDNSGVITLTNSTIAGNEGAVIGPGGIYNSHVLTITNSTIAGNTSPFGRVGGILNTEGAVVTLQNTILARNTRGDGEGGEVAADCEGPVTSLGTNLEGEPSGCPMTLLPTDLTGDPGLAAFTADGTPGHGHFPLLASSPAVDAANEAACLPTDQLGRPRVGPCDIGAVEFQAEAVTIHRAAFADRLARLWVSATSSAPPDAALTVSVPGCLAGMPMRRLGARYVLLRHVEACGNLNGQTVTVISTFGGSASAPLR